MQEVSRRTKQVANAIRAELVSIAQREISDPRLERAGMVTFSEVVLSTDHKNATVYVSFMGKEEKSQEVQDALKALQSAAGFIHRLLLKRIAMKSHPKLYFKFDTAFDRAAVVQEALNEAAEVERNASKVAKPEDE